MRVTPFELESFEEKCKSELELIGNSLNTFNIFNVLGIQHREIRHSNFLGWLFSPSETHQFNDSILKELLSHISKLDSFEKVVSELLQSDLSTTKVYRESVNNIDILIVNEELDFVITIENKINSSYSSHQLEKYYRYVEKQYRYLTTRIYLTLTPYPCRAHLKCNDGDKYININYKDIISILEANRPIINAASPTIKESINQYISMVQNDITKSSEEIEIAKRIYKTYKKEIDFIIQNQEDLSVLKVDILDLIENGGLEGFSISHDSKEGKVIFLLPDNLELRRLFYFPEAKSRGGDYIFSLVLHLDKDAIWLKFGFGNIMQSPHSKSLQEAKSKLFDAMKTFECFKNQHLLNLEMHPDTADMDYAGICGVQLFNDDIFYESEQDGLELFKEKFNLINKELIQPWIIECLSNFK